ncbi:unnamed protein product [Camellia sinensis]
MGDSKAISTLDKLATDGEEVTEDIEREEKIPTRVTHNIIFVTAEAAPYSKTGGLGDVCGSLPIALAARGHRVMVISPRYLHGGPSDKNFSGASDVGCGIKVYCFGGAQEVAFFHEYRAGVDWVFVDHPSYHRPGNPYGDIYGAFGDNQFRFSLLCHAACEAPLVLPLGGFTYGEKCLFIVNDWHAGLVPVLLAAKYRPYGVYKDARSILVIHNLAHQGVEPAITYKNLGLPPEWYGALEWVFPTWARTHALDTGEAVNPLKGAIVTADRILTVSKGYSWEITTVEGGYGLHELLSSRKSVLNDCREMIMFCGKSKNVDMVLEDVRPYLISDGGNVDVVSVADGVISLKLQGACGSCPSSTTTMKMGIERVLKEKFGDAVKDIRQVYDDDHTSETTVEAVNGHLDILRPAIKNYGGNVQVLSVEGGLPRESSGITNGVDDTEWNPSLDKHIPSHYSIHDLSGKVECKIALQKELGLPIDPDCPLIGFIGRLDYQKGIDIILSATPELMDEDVQFVMLGSGEKQYEDWMRVTESYYKDKFRGWVGFNVPISHRITAGCDILLMPSRFEPCGLNQLYAMRYGTIPVVHSTGGLRDTVENFNPYAQESSGEGTGPVDFFSFITREYVSGALKVAIQTYREFKPSWEGLMKRGMKRDSTWDNAAVQYEQVFEWAFIDPPYIS